MKSTVLIVDDEERNRDLMKAILGSTGHHLELAENGREAIRKTVELKPDLILLDVMMPDLILLDVMMPDMSGFEVCETIRRSPATVDIPIIMVTALDDRDSRLQGIEAGADDFISKPIDAGEMRTRVKNITQLNRYRRIVAEREKIERIAEFSTDGFLLLDDRSRIQFSNPRACELLGCNGEAMQNGDFIAAAGENFVTKPAFAWRTWAGTAEPDPKPVRYLLAKSGSPVPAKWLKTQLFLLPETGTADWLVRLSDITESVAERRDSWSFHRAITEKLSPTMADIGSELDQLGNIDVGMTGEKRVELAKGVRQKLHQLESQITNLLQYAQSSSMMKEGDPVKVRDIRYKVRFIADALGLFGVHVQIPYEAEAVALGIKSLAFETILTELLVNAVKFHPRHAPSVEVEVTLPTPDRIVVAVKDDGVTLSEQALANAAQPYYQDEANRGGDVAGLGLGLAMLSTMLWELDGEIELSNRDTGKGVTATFTLPVGVD